MAVRISRNAPYEIVSIDIHSINEVFRQIQFAIDKLYGLNGAFEIYDSVKIDGDTNITGNLTVGGSTTVENLIINGTVTGIDASDVTYEPANLADWGGVDPGNVDDALDFLAAHAGSGSGGGSAAVPTDTDLIDADSTSAPWEVVESDSLDGGSMRIQAAANGNAGELRALQPITVGDSLVGELQLLDNGADKLIYA